MASSVGGIFAAATQSAISGLHHATDKITISTARLASGNRLIRAGDDVAALSQAVKLQSNITSLRQALQNTTQADSFLQVAYSGLSSIGDILNDMNALAVQSASGSVTNTDRAFLQLEFQQLGAEIDRIASNTSFNDIKLLDGSLSQANTVGTPTTPATPARATLNFTANPTAGQTVIINNTTLVANTHFAIGGTTDITLSNLAAAINSSTNLALSNLEATAVGNSLTLADRGGGTRGQLNTVNNGGSSASFTTTGGTTISATRFSFTGALEDGLSRNSVIYTSGSSGDSLVNAVSQTQGQVRFTLSANPANNQTISIDSGNGAFLVLRYRNTPAVSTDIQIGATPEETIQNTIETIRAQTGGGRYVLDQMDFIRNGSTLVMRSRLPGNPVDLVGAQINFAETVSSGTLSNTTFNTGTNTGVNVSGVTNQDFIGTVSGFSATFNAANDITAEVMVGDYTYRAEINNTAPGTATYQRFISTTPGGGYFDVQLAAGGLAVANQTAADTFAARLDAAFSTLHYSQNRIATSFTGVGDLAGASFEFQLDDFSDVQIDAVRVTAPPSAGQSAVIEFDVSGETFRSNSNLGSSISQYEIIELGSLSSSNKLTLRMGNVQANLSTQTLANEFRRDIEMAFDLGNGSGSVQFQVGASSSDTLSVSIDAASTYRLFGGQTPDILSQTAAGDAQPILEGALHEVTGLMAEVGALQARTTYAANNLNNQILYKDQARAALMDTDIAFEATQLALATVQAKSAIAVLAQTQALASEMVSLLKNSR